MGHLKLGGAGWPSLKISMSIPRIESWNGYAFLFMFARGNKPTTMSWWGREDECFKRNSGWLHLSLTDWDEFFLTERPCPFTGPVHHAHNRFHWNFNHQYSPLTNQYPWVGGRNSPTLTEFWKPNRENVFPCHLPFTELAVMETGESLGVVGGLGQSSSCVSSVSK